MKNTWVFSCALIAGAIIFKQFCTYYSAVWISDNKNPITIKVMNNNDFFVPARISLGIDIM